MSDTRFNLDSFIVDKDKSFIQANIKQLKNRVLGVYIVPPKHAHRMDLISHFLYGTIAMKPYLMYINDIVDMSVVEHGFKLRYPSMRDILALMNETTDYIQ